MHQGTASAARRPRRSGPAQTKLMLKVVSMTVVESL